MLKRKKEEEEEEEEEGAKKFQEGMRGKKSGLNDFAKKKKSSLPEFLQTKTDLKFWAFCARGFPC
jgi:hypothetical protein